MGLDAGIGANSALDASYDVTHSLKFETDNTEYLMAEGRGQGNQQTWTYSCWLKRTEVDNGSVAQYIFSAGSDGKLGIYFRDDASYPDDRIFIYLDEGNSQKWIGQVNQSFRDTSAWYHFVFACDSTDSTPADRTKLYINGVQQTITFNATLNANVSTRVGDSGGKFAIGYRVGTGYGYNGYIAEAVLVDGSALPPTSFGEYDNSGIWKPKSPPALGTHGFHMNFDDSSNVGAVQSGTSQANFDKYNLSAADQATDTPTNNFCVMNPQWAYANSQVISNGATKTLHNTSTWAGAKASVGVNSGKWYWEYKTIGGNGTDVIIGIQTDEGVALTGNAHNIISTAAWYIGGEFWIKDSSSGRDDTNVTINSTASNSHTYAFALDLDSSPQTISVYQNNSLITNGGNINIDGLTNKTVFPFVACYGQNGIAFNFGGYTLNSISSAATDANSYGTFEYAPPSGYYALCTKNLAEYG